MADEKQCSQQSPSQISEEEQQKKTQWPELVGILGEEAKKKIELENSELTVVILPEGSIVTMDYNVKRVRIFVDSNSKVTRTPIIG